MGKEMIIREIYIHGQKHTQIQHIFDPAYIYMQESDLMSQCTFELSSFTQHIAPQLLLASSHCAADGYMHDLCYYCTHWVRLGE